MDPITSHGGTVSVSKTLASLLSVPANRSCADCRSTLVDASQIYASFSPKFDIPVSKYNHFHLNHQRFKPPAFEEKDASNGNITDCSDPPIDPSLQAAALVGGHGVFVCTSCAAAHQLLGKTFAIVRSVQDPMHWTVQEVERLANAGGNQHATDLFEAYMPESFERHHRPHADSNVADRLFFCRAKYQALSFILPPQIGPFAGRAWRDIINKHHADWKGLWGADLLSMSDLQIISQSRLQKGLGSSRLLLGGLDTGLQPRDALPNRLVDYFCVVTASEIVDPQRFSAQALEHNQGHRLQPEDIPLVPTMVDCYPEPEARPETEFPEHIATLVFPEGCRPRASPLPPSLFTFCLTSGTGDRLFGAVLRLYDDTKDADTLSIILQHAGIASSSGPMQNTNTTEMESDVVFFPKCLIVLSHYAFFDLWRKFLLQIYRIALVEAPLPIERFIANFVSEVPLPPPGKIQVRFGFMVDEIWLIQRPPRNQLPMANFSFRPLFSCLSVPHVLVLVANLLRETRVVLCSKHSALLCPVAEALLSFLFPFHWQGMYLPVLPDHLLEMLEAPVPYLVGIHTRYLETTPRDLWPKGVVFVDLDNDQVHLGYEEEGSESGQPRGIPSLPERLSVKLRNRLMLATANVYLPVENSSNRRGHMTTGNGEIFKVRDGYAAGVAPETEMPTFAGTSSRLVGSVHSPPAPSNKRRKEVFANIEKAYDDNELLGSRSGFLSEQGQLHEKDALSPRTKERMGPRFRFRRPSRGQSHASDDLDDAKGNLFDLKDPSGFDTDAIRNAFLYFFVSLFKIYRRYMDEDGTFRREGFVNRLSISPQSSAFVGTVLQTQLFDCFLRERSELPDDPEVRFFDEKIAAKLKRSKTNALSNISWGNRKETTFLTDSSGEITETYTPPPPSNWSLPDDGRSYRYSSFPVLDKDLFGKVRKPKEWPRTRSLRDFRHASTFIRNKEKAAFSKAMAPVMQAQKLVKAVAKRSARHLESALGTLSAPFVPPQQPSAAYPSQTVSDLTVGSSMEVDRDLIENAEEVVLNARRKQAILVSIFIKLQAYCRVFLAKRELERRVEALLRERSSSAVLASGSLQDRAETRKAAYAAAAKKKKAANAAKRIQAWYRARTLCNRFRVLRQGVNRLCAVFRGRNARLSYLLLLQVICRLQALARGISFRNKVQVVVKTRCDVYRHCIFLLWRAGNTPISYRSTFWCLLKSPSFLVLSLESTELKRMWKQLSLEIPVSVDAVASGDTDRTVVLASSLGMPDVFYGAAKTYVRTNSAKIGTDRPAIKPPVISREASERLQVYERLALSRDLEDDEMHFYCHLFSKERKLRKTAVATYLWQDYNTAHESSTLMMKLFPELRFSTDILYVKPSKKGLRRIPSSKPRPGHLEADMQAHARLTELIRRNVSEVAALGLTELPTLTLRLSVLDGGSRRRPCLDRAAQDRMRAREKTDVRSFRLETMQELLSVSCEAPSVSLLENSDSSVSSTSFLDEGNFDAVLEDIATNTLEEEIKR